LITHHWQGFFQVTNYNAGGYWTPDSGDTVTDVVLERAPNGTDNFTDLSGLGLVDENDDWSTAAETLHDGQTYHLRGGVVYSTGSGSGVQYSSNSVGLSREN